MKSANQIFILFLAGIILLCFCSYSFAASKKPPFASVTIYGKTDNKFNKVSLFKSGGDTKPYKTIKIDSNGKYSMNIRIPQDMIKKEGYYLSDMRFWNDGNNNQVKDEGESISQCHFVMWYPDYNKVVMQVYQVETFEINTSELSYNWQ
jgi:hypothetical protein